MPSVQELFEGLPLEVDSKAEIKQEFIEKFIEDAYEKSSRKNMETKPIKNSVSESIEEYESDDRAWAEAREHQESTSG